MRSAILAVGVFISAGCAHCINGGNGQKEIAATVRCGELQGFSSALGNLNTPSVDLGAILYVVEPSVSDPNGPGPVLSRLRTVPISDTTTGPAETVEATLNAGFELIVNGELPAGIARADIEVEVKKRSKVLLTEGARIDAAAPLDVVNGSVAALKEVSEAASANPNIRFFVVATVTAAKKLELKAGTETGVNTDVSVLNVGHYKVKVTYDCDERFTKVQKDSNARVLFKVTAFKYDRATNRVVAAPGEDITKYRWEHVL